MQVFPNYDSWLAFNHDNLVSRHLEYVAELGESTAFDDFAELVYVHYLARLAVLTACN